MVVPGSPDDAPAIAALSAVVHRDRLNAAAGIRHSLANLPAAARLRTWKVEEEGSLVGWAVASLEPWATHPGRAECQLMVHPDRRRRGIGSALWQAVTEHLDAIGGRHVIATSGEDDASKRFCERRGFHHTSTSEVLGLDPRALGAPPSAPAGTELLPFTAFDDLEVLYRVDWAASQDEPGDHDFTGLSLELWLWMTFDHPLFDRVLGHAVLVEGEVVGLCSLYADRASGRALNAGTGVLAHHRGLGLATLMKRTVLARAAEAGITWVITENDETNAPMLAINRRLGYAPFATRHGWTLDR